MTTHQTWPGLGIPLRESTRAQAQRLLAEAGHSSSYLRAVHSRASDRWQTPDHLLDVGRYVLGPTEWCDVATDASAQRRVQAPRFWTAEDDHEAQREGRALVWGPRWFCNWPGSQSRLFTARILDERVARRVEAGFVVLFRWDHSTDWCSFLLEAADAVCLLRKRTAFVNPTTGKPGDSPPHPSALAFVGSDAEAEARFHDRCSSLGKVL